MIYLNLGLARPSRPTHCPQCPEEKSCSCRLYRGGPQCYLFRGHRHPLTGWRYRSCSFGPDLISYTHLGCRWSPTPQHGSCEPVVSWVTLSTFRAGPQMPRTAPNYSLNESLFSAINDFNYRPFKCGSIVAMPNLANSGFR